MEAAQRGAPVWALGLMTGTSMDGLDAAWLKTDGERARSAGPAISVDMPDDLRADLVALAAGRGDAAAVEAAYTAWVAEGARAALTAGAAQGLKAAVVGFHGQTLLHAPARGRPGEGRSWQLGDGPALARSLGVPVVYEFRAADVAAGGEGAPFASLFHDAITADQPRPLALLNLGGVGNVTYLAKDAPPLAFDTGPANAPCDDLVRARTGAACDRDGALALAGRADAARIASWLRDPYFAAEPPKSLDRETFAKLDFDGLSLEDAAATAMGFAAASVAKACDHLPAAPKRWLLCGGGRKNPALVAALRAALAAPVDPVEAIGWDGDAIEAYAFAHLAVRSLQGRPLSLPTTTGVPTPMAGGVLAA
ncbi:MAG: anhydro-N-acetylmuramic acid kinase [Pseudomonadota bacterium]